MALEKEERKLTEPVIFNTNKIGGWEIYYRKSNKNEKLDKAINNPDESVEKLMKNIDKEMKNLKYSSFGKVLNKRKFVKGKEEVNKIQYRKSSLPSNENELDVESMNAKLGVPLNKLNSKHLKMNLPH